MGSFAIASQKIFRFGLPMAITRIINAANLYIGMIMLAWLGSNALAAGALISSIYVTLLLICMGFLFSIGIMVAKQYGSNQLKEAGNFLKNGLFIVVLISVPVFIFMNKIGVILNLIGQNPKVVQIVQEYFRYASYGVFPWLSMVVFNQFFTGISQQKFIMYITLICLPINTFLSYSLLFGKFGFPELGVGGISLAVTLTFWVSFFFVFFFLKKDIFKEYDIFSIKEKISMSYIKLLFKIGAPMSIQFAAELGAFMVAALIIGTLGVQALAAQQIITQSTMLVTIIPFSIGQAVSILVSQEFGRKDVMSARNTAKAGLLLGFLLMSIIAIIYLFKPIWIISIYTDAANFSNAKIVELAKLLLCIAAISQIIDGARNIISGALAGALKTKIPMWFGIMAFWGIGLPLGYCLAVYLNWGVIGMAAAFALGVSLALALLIVRFNNTFQVNETYNNAGKINISTNNSSVEPEPAE